MLRQDFESLLADYLDGTLDAAGREALAAEIERDPAAAQCFDAALRFEALLAAAHAKTETRDTLFAGIRLRAHRSAVRPLWRKPRTLLAVAALILAAIGIGIAFSLFSAQAPNRVLAGHVEVNGVYTTQIANGATIKAVGDEEAKISLADGSTAKFAPQSVAVLRGPAGQVRQVVELASGRGSFDVLKRANEFKIETVLGSVTVTGTVFVVELRPKPPTVDAKSNLMLAVTVESGKVRVRSESKDYDLTPGPARLFPEEVKQEEQAQQAAPQKEEHKLSDKAAQATIAGIVWKRDGQVLWVNIEKVDGVTEWKAPKNETGHVKVGEPLAIYAQFEQAEGKMRPAKATMETFEKLRPGDKIEAGIYYQEHPRAASITFIKNSAEEHKSDKPK